MARSGRRVVLVVLGLLIVVGGTGAAWYVAADARTPGQRAAEAAPPPRSVITAKVAGGELEDSQNLNSSFVRTNNVFVRGPASSNSGRAVVTKLPVARGAEVGNGTLIADVSGRPLIALVGAFPAYRDLSEGDKGPDVAQLQAALKVRYRTPVTGEFDARTAADVRKLYQSVRYDPVLVKPDAAQDPPPPDKVKVPAGEVSFVPELPATVDEVNAKVGDDANAVLLTLTSGPWQLVATLEAGTEQLLTALPAGARLILGAGPGQGKAATLVTVRPAMAPGGEPRGGGSPTTAAPASGAPAPGSEPKTTENAAVFTVDGAVSGVTSGQAQEIVIERQRSPAGAVIVPASALATRPDGTVEITVVAGSTRRPVRVEVKMSFQGQVAVAGELSVGDEVLVGESR